MDETCEDETGKEKLENLADESSSSVRTSDAKDLRGDEDGEKAKQEEIILSAEFCNDQLTRTVPSSNCRDSSEISPKLSNLNSESNKNTLECYGIDSENEASAHYESCGSPELQTDITERHYEILTFKTETCGDTMDNRLYEPVDCHETRGSYDGRGNCAKETSSSSRLSEMKKSNLPGTPKGPLTNSTIQTIPVTVARDNKARCLEKILINEETLNKVIVPTACGESGMESAERIRERFSSMNRQDEAVNNNASKKMIRDHQVECVKKDGFSTRNVFVKTKRMIFGPFRRSEERPSSRKQSDSSVDGRLPRSKSKSKSRSASPKLCRQDALLRVSLSLPWPLRSMSKDSETSLEAESRRSSGSKVEDATATQEKNSLHKENNVESKRLNKQLSNEAPPFIDVDGHETIRRSDTELVVTPINVCSIGTTSARVSEHSERSKTTEWDQSACRSEFKCSQIQDGGERDKTRRGQVQFEGKRDREGNHSQKQGKGWQEVKLGRKQNEEKQRDENHARCDAVPSDLMHKLRILSDAAAKREGRVTTADSSVVSSLESRSSKIRRAKESFLSRRGGPFCRSGMEPAGIADNPEDPWGRTRISTITEIPGSNGITASGEPEDAGNRTEAATLTGGNEIVSGGEGKVDASQAEDRAIDVAVRSDALVKSASAGMINVDPDTFDRLVTTDRGCESLPRTIAKRRDSSLAKIVGKLKLSRLIRARNIDGGNMSTITTLCRQSLLIDMRNGNRNSEREIENDLIEDATDDTDDDQSGESSKTVQE